PEAAPLLTGVNSFGFGGANAHVVLEGPPAQRTSLISIFFPFAGRGSKREGDAAASDRSTQRGASGQGDGRTAAVAGSVAEDALSRVGVLGASRTAPQDSARAGLLVTSARSSESLRGLARAYRDLALRPEAPAIGDLVAAAARHRAHHEHRLAVVG